MKLKTDVAAEDERIEGVTAENLLLWLRAARRECNEKAQVFQRQDKQIDAVWMYAKQNAYKILIERLEEQQR